MLLLAGDLTRHGTESEARCVAQEFGGLGVPVVTVLGNHDHQCDQVPQVVKVLEDAGITVLEGNGVVLDCAGGRLGIAGVKGFGGGFAGRCASDFGEPEMKAFVRTTTDSADRAGQGAALAGLRHAGRAHPLLPGAGHAGRRAAGDLPVPRLVPAGAGDRLGADRAGPARARARRHASGAPRPAGYASATWPTR